MDCETNSWQVRLYSFFIGKSRLEIDEAAPSTVTGVAALVSGGPLRLHGKVSVPRFSGALVHQEDGALGERLRIREAKTRGHGPVPEKPFPGAKQQRVDP